MTESVARTESSVPWRNKNVRLSFALVFAAGVAESVWLGTVLSAFLFGLANKIDDRSGSHSDGPANNQNTYVGSAEAFFGASQLLFALPVGYLADRFSRSSIIACGGVLGLFAVALTSAAVYFGGYASVRSSLEAYDVLMVGLIAWGVVEGVSNGPAQALFAESVPEGDRSEFYTYLFAVYLSASVVGPLVCIVLFEALSDDVESWTLRQIAPVFVIGQLLEIPMCVIMFFFDDDARVKEETSECVETTSANVTTLMDPLLESNSLDNQNDSPLVLSTSNSPPKRSAFVPVVLFASSLVGSLGSGMSVKFFPLFFKDLGFSPQQVQAIYVCVPLLIAAFSFGATRFGRRVGRIEATIVCNLVGCFLLFLLCFVEQRLVTGKSNQNVLHSTSSGTKWLVVSIYLVRTGAMNCTYPLLESVLMDVVSPDSRARWKSLESISAFGWCGSGALLFCVRPFFCLSMSDLFRHSLEENSRFGRRIKRSAWILLQFFNYGNHTTHWYVCVAPTSQQSGKRNEKNKEIRPRRRREYDESIAAGRSVSRARR